VASIAVALMIVLAGLVFVRWVAFATPGESLSRLTRAEARAPVPDREASLPVPSERDEMLAARDEAVRLAEAALAEDDLATAKDLYFLALQAVPDDEESAKRLRQVETAVNLASYDGPMLDAVLDLDDLREATPGSSAVLEAYVSALVAAGNEAVVKRAFDQAWEMCGEAVRWLSSREDARACLARVQAASAPPSTPTRTPVLPSPTLVPSATTTATPFATVAPPGFVPRFIPGLATVVPTGDEEP
jgi:hypothetical protein